MVTQTRKLTEGAMMVALVGLMLFVNLQLGGMPELDVLDLDVSYFDLYCKIWNQEWTYCGI